jgi:hypothetical protein
MVVGVVLVLLALYGFFVGTANLLGIFGVNMLQSIIHLVAGGLLIWLAGRTATMWLGWIALLVGVLGLVLPALMASLLNVNMAITYLHLVIGVVSILLYYLVKDGSTTTA